MAYKTNVPIFSMRMAGYLMYHNCLLVDLAPNKKMPGRDVYYFVDTHDLHRRQKEYLKMADKDKLY